MPSPQSTPALPPAHELVDRLSPETAQGFAEMDAENVDMCKQLLRRAGLGALIGVIDLLRPEALA